MVTFIIKLFPLKDLILYSKERVLTKIVRRELIGNDPRVKTTTFACIGRNVIIFIKNLLSHESFFLKVKNVF